MEKDYFRHDSNRNVERGFVMPLSTYLATDEECVVDGLSLKTPATAVKNTREGRGSRISSCRVVSSAPSPMLLPQSGRNQRRCWSPELHHRFVKALEELGGSQATPKQIRELMRVDGLTNDEVKSHLQKYRLHTRRVPAATAANCSISGADLGGLWMHKESLKGTSSCSPQGPLQFATKSGETTSTTEGDNMIDDDIKLEEFHIYSRTTHDYIKEDGSSERGF
ncbi:transcription factor HHO6-like isoform X2 [Vigna umbellata]|uniref:transcription factor HHO6-like isoform X2 n=1 Tax=Vigna umbellata TaxID=87088 RepID=UPI001F5F3D89|nr:transcription factor HHO6-like isoform X2 [Vigna umbellata]